MKKPGLGRVRRAGDWMPASAIRLGVGIFFAVAATNILTPVLPNITLEFGVSYSEGGLLVTIYILARLVASVAAGFAAARIPVARLAGVGVVLLMIGPTIGLLSMDLVGLFVSRFVTGAGTGVLVTLSLSALGAIAPPGSRGRVMSIFQLAHNAGIAIYPLLGGIIGDAIGWRSSFVVVAGAGLVSGAILLPTLLRVEAMELVPDRPRPAGKRRGVLPAALLVAYVGVFVTMFNRHGFRNTVLPLYEGGVVGLDPVQISTGISIMSLIGFAIAVPGAMSSDRWGPRRVIALGLFALAVGDLAFLVAGEYGSFLAAAVALGLGDFFIGSQSALIASLAPAGQRAKALGGFRLATDLGTLIGPVALATTMDTVSPHAAMVLAATLLVAAAVVTWLLVPRGTPASAGVGMPRDPVATVSER